MLVKCSGTSVNAVRKILETLLDGAEEVMIIFNTNGIVFKTVDSLSICMYTFIIPCSNFEVFDVEYIFQMSFKTRPVYEIIRKNGTNDLVFMSSDNINLQVVVNNDRAHHVDRISCSTYFTIPQNVFLEYPCFSIDPVEFSYSILDMAVSGKLINIVFNERDAYWTTRSEMCNVTIRATDQTRSDHQFRVIRSTTQDIKNTYITKFLKQGCGIALVSNTLMVYIDKDAPVVLHFKQIFLKWSLYCVRSTKV